MNPSSTPFQPPPPEELENLLPNFTEIQFLAQGGMAAVYKGLQTSLERPVAIKVLPREFGSDEAFRIRFEAEAKIMAKLNHPNLVAIYDFGEVNDLLYLIMEFVEGETLHEFCQRKKLDQIEALGISANIAEGLAHAHENNVLHRDIKSANILLDSKKNPKLGDFGLAHGAERDSGDDLTFGTPGYTAPEVISDPHSADLQSDIFSIGVLLYELLTGELPAQEFIPPSEKGECDPRIDTIISKCIHPHPESRYPSARVLAKELKKVRTLLQNRSQRPDPSPPLAPVGATGPDFNLFRNLIIIAGLSLAIWGAWTALKNKKANLAAQQAIVDKKAASSERRQAAAAEAKRREFEANLSSLAEKKEPRIEVPVNSSEIEEMPPSALDLKSTPSEQLSELKPALASGSRDRFPDTTLVRNNSHFFFVETPLTWHEAITFAEDHGAHLAILPTEEDLTWATSIISAAEQVWLGAGSRTKEDWAWFDGRIDFQFPKPSINLGTALSMTDLGLVKASQPSTRLPFLIEWNNDPSYSLSREAQLASLESSDNDIWPVGTLSHDNSHYLIIARSLTLEEASAYATRYHGHLAVASSEAEASFLRDSISTSGLEKIWLGGLRNEGAWSWFTSEPWAFARWADDFPASEEEANGLLLTSEGWMNQDPELAAPGFIIEWSPQTKNLPSGEIAESSGSILELEELRSKAKELLSQETNEKLKNNYAAQGMAIRQWLRSISQEDADRIEKKYHEYAGDLESTGGRLTNPNNFHLGSSSLYAQGEKILLRHYEIQEQIDGNLKDSAEKLRVHYLQKVEAIAAKAEAKGLASQVQLLEQEITSVGADGISFLRHLELAPNTGTFRKLEIISVRFGSRGKFADVTETVKQKLKDGERFRVLAKVFGVDPDPGWNKSIQITYQLDGETFTPWFHRNALVHEDVLIKKADSLKAP